MFCTHTIGAIACLAGGVTGQNVGDYKVPGGDVMNSTGMKAGGGYRFTLPS